MKKLTLLCLLFLLLMSFQVFAADILWHYVTLPLIEGTGAYTAISALIYSDNTFTWTTSIITLSLIGLNSTVGISAVFLLPQAYPTLRVIHRIIGFTAFAAATVMSIALSIDDKLEGKATRYTGYVYNAALLIPVFMYTF